MILGVAIVAAVYFFGRKKERDSLRRLEPALGHRESRIESRNEVTDVITPIEEELLDFNDVIARGLESEVADFRPQQRTPKPETAQDSGVKHKAADNSMLLEQELVVLNLFAPSQQSFNGMELYAAMHNAGFVWQEDQLFHRNGSYGEYLALNALKPGTFPRKPVDFSTRVVALILQLPRVKSPVHAFDEFLKLAKQLQSDLDARLCDGQRSSLTGQTIAYLRDEVQRYQFKHR